MDVTLLGMMTTALQVNVNTVGAEDGATEGAMDMVGAEVGVREGGPEMHVDRPELVHAGYTQAGVEAKGPVPNVIPEQFSITAILRLLQLRNA